MLRVYSSIAHGHDLRLVVVAGLICLLASWTALGAFQQARQRPRWLVWIGLASLVSGIGIWATHFIAMLAFRPGVDIGYEVWTTVLSVVAAVLISGVGWTVALSRHAAAPAAAGAIIGVGVATMHYTGMAAVSLAGHIHWDKPFVLASVALGLMLASGALIVHCRTRQSRSWAAGVVLTLAICTLHFTAMAAAVIHPDQQVAVPAELVNNSTLALAVKSAALLVVGISFGLILADRGIARAQLKAELAEEVLRSAVERERLSAEVQRQADISNAALNNMVQGLSMFDAQGRLVTHNRRYAEIYSLPDDLLVPGTSMKALLDHLVSTGDSPRDALERAASDPNFERSTTEIQLLSGRIINIQRRPLPQGGWVATHEDVTEIREATRQIAFLAAHDALTGLPNRVAFAERLAAAAASSAVHDGFAVHTIDLDRFKEVNDTLGHPIGDEILKQVAARIRSATCATDFVTRLGGDEFAVLQLGVSRQSDASALARRIVEKLAQPFRFDGHTIAMGASVGIARAPEHATDGDELLKLSDLALYRAKSDSRGTFRFFEPGMDARLRGRRKLEMDLIEAIQDQQLEVYYQPRLDVEKGSIGCFEALVRWNHPTAGMVQPADFIPLAEETGLIIPMGEWVLRQACRDAASWQPGVRVAVNLSPAQFKRGDLIAMTASALAAAGLSPARLELEVTESVLLNDEEWVRRVLRRLTQMGVSISMDDFGTGYSSLSYLRSFPFSKIKIDRSFVADLVESPDCLAIVHATIDLAQKLGMTTTAQGVETREQMETLAAHGCTESRAST